MYLLCIFFMRKWNLFTLDTRVLTRKYFDTPLWEIMTHKRAGTRLEINRKELFQTIRQRNSETLPATHIGVCSIILFARRVNLKLTKFD